MIITCPHCNARYKVQDGLITERGKKVKCKKCTSVFIAYPDKPSILQRPPENQEAATAAKPPAQASGTTTSDSAATSKPKATAPAADQPAAKQAPPTPPSDPASPAPQATVKVDRSMLNNFIQDAAQKVRQEKPAEPKQDEQKLQKFIDNSTDPESGKVDVSGGATVQVDRSKIDAFMQGKNEEDGDQDASLRTMQVDREQMNQALRQNQPPGSADEQPSGPGSPHATVQVDRASLDQALQQGPDGVSGADAAGAGSDLDDELPATPDFSGFDDDAGFGADQGSGLAEMPSFDDDEFSDSAPDVGADIPAFQSGEDLPSFSNLDHQAPTPTAAGPTPPSGSETTLYKAQIDGRIYPDLDLNTIGQWIKEERLLETDLIAPMDSAEFQQADNYPQFAKFFIEYYGQANTAAQEQAPAEPEEEKKGFISRLFGKKK